MLKAQVCADRPNGMGRGGYMPPSLLERNNCTAARELSHHLFLETNNQARTSEVEGHAKGQAVTGSVEPRCKSCCSAIRPLSLFLLPHLLAGLCSWETPNMKGRWPGGERDTPSAREGVRNRAAGEECKPEPVLLRGAL